MNEIVWNMHPKYMHLLPHDFILEVAEKGFCFTADSVVINTKDEMVNAISKTSRPNKIVLNHKSAEVLNDCVDWLIKYCEVLGKLLPSFESSNEEIFDRLEEYKKIQIKKNKRRRRKKAYN